MTHIREVKPAILTVIEAELGRFDHADRVVIHGSALHPDFAPSQSDIDLAILVKIDPCHWSDLWRIEERLNQEFANQGLIFDVVVVKTIDALKFRRSQNHFNARLLITGYPIWPDSEEATTNILFYTDALIETATETEHRAAEWLAMTYRRSCEYGAICCFAYMAACQFVKAPLIRADWSVWPKPVRWRLDRLVQMAAWLDPALAAGWVNNRLVVEVLRPDYFVPWRQWDTYGFPLRTEVEAQAALAAAWRIGCRFAPAAVRMARLLLDFLRNAESLRTGRS